MRTRAAKLAGYAERAVSNPVVAYGAVAAIQLRVIWNIWKYKDLVAGDSSDYFVDAASWAHGLHENIVYYPLYDAFWGTILAIVHDVYAAATIHRILIVLAVTLLVLALMRSLLGPAIGLLIAIWWAVTPANYNVLYEVHLFGATPILLAALLVARARSRVMLGSAVAILAASAVLIRNELLIAAAIFAAVIVVHEFRRRRTSRARLREYAWSYGLPLLLACVVIGVTYALSYVHGQSAWQLLEAKERLNLCEAYAVGFQQHHPALVPGNPWLTCSTVMRHSFGETMPTFFQALAANPRAIGGFILWNARLLPGGFQVALFDGTSVGSNPSYRPVTQHDTTALVLSIVLLAVLVAGIAVAWRTDRIRLRAALGARKWPLTMLASIAVATLAVVLTERPSGGVHVRPDGLRACRVRIVSTRPGQEHWRASAGRSGGARPDGRAARLAFVPLPAGAASDLRRGSPPRSRSNVPCNGRTRCWSPPAIQARSATTSPTRTSAIANRSTGRRCAHSSVRPRPCGWS